MQRRLLEGKQQLVSTGELEVGQLQARGSSTLTTRSSNASRDSPALTPHPSPVSGARLDADKEKLVEMRAREGALEATEAAAAAAAEKRGRSRNEPLRLRTPRRAPPDVHCQDSGALRQRRRRRRQRGVDAAGRRWLAAAAATDADAARSAERRRTRGVGGDGGGGAGRLKERRASYQAERLDERERVRDAARPRHDPPPAPPSACTTPPPSHLRLHARLPAPSHHRWRASSASCAPSSRRWRRRRSTRRPMRRRRAPSSSRSRRRRRRARRRPSSKTI